MHSWRYTILFLLTLSSTLSYAQLKGKYIASNDEYIWYVFEFSEKNHFEYKTIRRFNEIMLGSGSYHIMHKTLFLDFENPTFDTTRSFAVIDSIKNITDSISIDIICRTYKYNDSLWGAIINLTNPNNKSFLAGSTTKGILHLKASREMLPLLLHCDYLRDCPYYYEIKNNYNYSFNISLTDNIGTIKKTGEKWKFKIKKINDKVLKLRPIPHSATETYIKVNESSKI